MRSAFRHYEGKVLMEMPSKAWSKSHALRLILLTILAEISTVLGDVGGSTESKSSALESSLVADARTMLLFELAIAALVVAFVIVYIIGSNTNTKIARKVASSLADVLSLQFAKIGTESGKILIKDGQSFFWFYATGRRFTTGLTVFMDLAKRMDLFGHTSSLLTSPQKDRCIFFLPLADDVKMEPMSMFLVRKKELSRLRELNEGVALRNVESLSAHVTEAHGIPGDFVVMAEHPDIPQLLLPDNIRSIIRENWKHLTSIHVTENGAAWEPQCRVSKKLIRVEFVLPSRQREISSVLEGMAEISMHLVDTAAQCKLTPVARKKAQDLRKKAVEEADRREQKKRAEEAAQRRLDKKKEEEEAVGKMSREKQRKYEEKKRKKELNAKIRKVSRK